MSDLKESKISSENVYKGSFLNIRKDRVTLPMGKHPLENGSNIQVQLVSYLLCQMVTLH
jgi:hypothetical protein